MSPVDIGRRQFSAALLGLSQKSDRMVSGTIVDQSHLIGHKLRDRRKFTAPKQQVKIPLVIIGGGISGLSAAWRLDKKGFRDFVVLELEKDPGGNSRWGENEVSAYPWAAHYLPVPNRESALLRELCAELGLRDGERWEERHLCHSPQERVFIHGKWQEGLEPEVGVPREERAQLRRFLERMAEFAATREFTIPIVTGMKASELDRVSMKQWMRDNGFTAPSLDWYVDYGCRDDYGSRAADTSAWAGVHYFASREHDDKGPFTWPEGNGWLTRQLLKRVGRYVKPSSMVTRVEAGKRGVRVMTEQTEYLAEFAIWAAPTFVLQYVSEQAPDIGGMVYSPWLTANVTL
ncbi:MAG: FAD-dependent oxidoreductase, partial [Acidobacteria bacterium]|nr:FAD-dependent oxidoreductase [Acidobacteriota bacterium]